jgi:hypothetical protein
MCRYTYVFLIINTFIYVFIHQYMCHLSLFTVVSKDVNKLTKYIKEAL